MTNMFACMSSGAFGFPLPYMELDVILQGHESVTAENGPWVITLDALSFMSVMQRTQSRDLREEVYRAYLTRASSGDLDNTAIIDQILKFRLEKAKLLGYNNFAEVLILIMLMSD